MKKRSRLKKGLAMLLAIAMVVGLLPGVGTMKVSAAEVETDTSSGVTFTALDGAPEGYGSNERYPMLLDGTADTKWCCGFENPSYVIFKASEPIYVNGYSVWTADDSSQSSGGRNPVAWTLSGCNDYDETNKSGGDWTVIDEVTSGGLPAANKTETKFTFAQTAQKYQYFKLNITSIKSGGTMQLGELSLTYKTCEHNWGEVIRTISPTCTEGGYDVKKCTICQVERKIANNNPANGHNWETESEVSPTCTEGGYDVQKCKECNATRNETNGKPAKGHTWTYGTQVASTCTTKGYTPKTCSVCNAEEKEYISALGHNFVNGTCSRCSANNLEVKEPETIDGVYQIGTYGELRWFAGLVNGDGIVCTDGNKNIKANAVLTANITANSNLLNSLTYDKDSGKVTNGNNFTSWTPIGYYDKNVESRYAGEFDGQGYTVSGLYYNNTDSTTGKYGGLFGYVGSTGKISNVGVVDSYINACCNVGGVCGNCRGTITNCYNTGTVSGTGTGTYETGVGGVCGVLYEGEMKNSYNTGKVSSLNDEVGGVCGRVYKSPMTECYNAGKVSGKARVGGVCGWNDISGTITNSYNTGDVSGTSFSVGGVCGGNKCTIANSYNTGNVSGKSHVGGVCGSIAQYCIITNSYNTGDVSGTSYYVGGVCGSDDTSSTITNSYNTGTVSGDSSVGGVCGSGSGIVKNCYYLADTEDSLSGRTKKQFNDGMVTYFLAKGCTVDETFYDGSIWGQDLSQENSYPVFNGKMVYTTTPCPSYSNEPSGTKEHTLGDDGICTVCGGIGAPKFNEESNCYEIGNLNHLLWFAGLVNGTLTDGTPQNTAANAVLTKNIVVNSNVLSAEGTLNSASFSKWTPIGNLSSKYTGTFDGKGFTVSGLYFDDTNSTTGVDIGLFGYVGSTGKISNLGVVDSYINAYTRLGGVCGRNYGTITNCYNKGIVSGTYYYVGGVCGSNYGTITNSNNTGKVSGTSNSVGGVCGYNDTSGSITSSHNTGTVSGKNWNVGGVCGYNGGSITSSHNTGTVSGEKQYVGGVCGNSGSGSITGSYNTGTVNLSNSSNPTYYVGGVCGYNYPNSIITNSYNTGEVKGNGSHHVGGVCGENTGTISNSYNTGNVSGSSSVNGVCGSGYGTITNCYYDCNRTDYKAERKTTEEFKSGEVAYLLNNGNTNGSQVWYQTIDGSTTETYPNLDSTNSASRTVYASAPCPSTFSNDPEKLKTVEHSYIVDANNKTKHICEKCDLSEEHHLTYAVVEGNPSIKVTCDACNGNDTVTLNKPESDGSDSLTYDGSAKEATVNLAGALGFTNSDITITYKKGEEELQSAPTDAGTYTASITLGEDEGAATVSVEFAISPATPAITWQSSAKTVNCMGNAISIDKIGAPTVTLVNEESYEGTIQYSYRAKDSSGEFTSGLPTEVGTYEVKAGVAADGNYTAAEATMTLTIEWLSDVSDATLTDQDGNTLTGNTWWAQSVTFTPPEGFTICDTVNGTYADSYTYNEATQKEGTEVIYYLKNSAGEIAKKTATVRVDTAAPDWTDGGISIKTNKWKELLNTISFGLFYKEEVDVTVSASDSLSGVAKYNYYVDTSESATVLSETDLDALEQDGKFTEYAVPDENASQTITSLSGDNNYVVYVYAADQAGNKSAYICSNGVVIDKTNPTISDISTPSKGSGDDDATLTDTGADMTFTASEGGTYFYIAKEGSEGAPAAITDFAVSSVDANTGMTLWTEKEGVAAAAMTADGNNKISLSGLTADTAYTIYVIGVDQAGNVSNILSRSFTTCKTMAEITTLPALSGTYGTAVSAMTLTDGVAKAGDTVIKGTWTLTDTNASEIPGVGTASTYKVTFTPNDTDAYETLILRVKPAVEPKAVTVTADNKTKTYGEDNPALTFTITAGSLVDGDAEADLGVTLSCEAAKDSPVTENGYAITGTSDSANYDVTVTPGTLTINRAAAVITVGDTEYSKTFGDEAFDLGVTDNNTDEGADVLYEVSDSKNAAGTSVENHKVITVDTKGKVTIVGAGSATITVSLPESNNYNAADNKVITVTVAKKGGYTAADINRAFYYNKDSGDSINLLKYAPQDCGNAQFRITSVDGAVEYTEAPSVEGSTLSYTVKAGAAATTGTVGIEVTSDNYETFTIAVKVNLKEKIAVHIEDGTQVTLKNNVLTYGEELAALEFNEAVFLDENGNPVAGSLAWQDSSIKPTVADSGVTGYTVVFIPADSEGYYTSTASVKVVVNKSKNTPNMPAAAMDAAKNAKKVSDVRLPEGWAWNETDADTALVAGETVTVKAVYTGSDKGNYEVESVDIAVTRQVCEHTHTEVQNAKAATCTEKGYTGDTYCEDCGVKISAGTEVAALGHEYTSRVTKEPTVDSEGVRTYTCTRCGDEYTEVIPKLEEEHTHTNTEVRDAKEATCTEKGYTGDTYCKDCGEKISAGEEIAALGHSYTSKVTKAATITSTGIRTYTCTRCGHQYTEVIPKLPIVAPAKGRKLTDTKNKAVFKVTRAGKVTTSASTGKVTVTAGEVAYTKTTNTSATTLTIPSTVKINGITYKVTSIGANAFANNKKLTKVTMGSYVKTIGSKAFYKCTKLKTVKIGKSVTTIGASAFYGCTKLDTVSMGAKVTTISDKAFYKCTALKAITIPATVKKIGKQAFYGCKKLKTVTIKTTKLSGSKVGSKAFTGIYSKATVKVPKSKYASYKKLLKAKGLGAKASVKK